LETEADPSQTNTVQARLSAAENSLTPDLRHSSTLGLIQLSLAEDLTSTGELSKLGSHPAKGDITSTSTLDPSATLTSHIIAKADGVVAGMPIAAAVFKLVDTKIALRLQVSEGQKVMKGQTLAKVEGSGPALLAGERTALNFLCRVSGIATLTRKFVDAVDGTGVVILDTRKTSPGSRHLDKYAVRMGGGRNHRMGLYDMVLIKDNHIAGAGGLLEAVQLVRHLHGNQFKIEIEVKTIEELEIGLRLPVDRIMLDNMDLETIHQAVSLTNRHTPLEVSGNVTLNSVRAIAETGVDFISIGALTHSAPVLDISLDVL
jgi:nicotinate-nucleotide pyrophosphorylase (carboxylating)